MANGIDFDAITDAELRAYMEEIDAAVKKRSKGGKRVTGVEIGEPQMGPRVDVQIGKPQLAPTPAPVGTQGGGSKEGLAGIEVAPTDVQVPQKRDSHIQMPPLTIRPRAQATQAEDKALAVTDSDIADLKRPRVGKRMQRLLGNPAISNRLVRKGAFDEAGVPVRGFDAKKLRPNEQRVYNYRLLELQQQEQKKRSEEADAKSDSILGL